MPPKKEDLDERVEVQEGSRKGTNPLVIILLVANMLLVGALGAYFVFFIAPSHSSGSETGEASGEDGESGSPGDTIGPIVELEPFLVNLDEPGANRYLKAVIQLEVDNSETLRELQQRSVQVKDLVITYLSSLTYAQTQGVGNKDIIRITLIRQINKILSTGKVKRLYFTEFVIQ